MRILVTGAAGFIGSHVVDALLDAGHDVVGLDALLPGAHAVRPTYLDPRATWLEGDVRDAALLRHCLQGVDHVCHQAAMVGLGVDLGDIVDYVGHNDVGTAVLLRELAAARFGGRLVLASSMVVYGEGRYACPEHGDVRPGPRPLADLQAGRFEPPCPHCGAQLSARAIDEDAPADPRNVYGATKLHQEHLCGAFARETGVTVTALRYHNVYGPRMPRDTPYAGVASIFRSAVAAGRAPRVFEDGAQRRDFVHVRDVAAANVLALTTDAPGPFNVASGVPRTVGELAAELCAAAGAALQPQVTGQFRAGDVRHVFASPQRAEKILGFRAGVPFAQGVAEFATAELRESSV